MDDMIKKYSLKTEPSLFDFVNIVVEETDPWRTCENPCNPWFRGQDRESTPLPSIFRGDGYDEYQLCTTFRDRVSALKNPPETKRLDKWLYLMQHYRCPTRLLDWTESLLNAIFFALRSHEDLCDEMKRNLNPTIWAIHPLELNKLSISRPEFPNTWTKDHYGREYTRLAFSYPRERTRKQFKKIKKMSLPIAIQTDYSDMRIFSQQSCFTIHGIRKEGFIELFDGTELTKNGYFLKFIIPNQYSQKWLNELYKIGVNEAHIFPDIEHFSRDLKRRFQNGKQS